MRFLAIGVFAATAMFAQNTQPDNTRMNKDGGVTADQQKMNRSDRDVTQQIRKSVMADKSLSTYAHNVKIVSQNGRVTLRGPVRSDEEKKNVESKAIEVAGSPDRVDDQLTVKQK